MCRVFLLTSVGLTVQGTERLGGFFSVFCVRRTMGRLPVFWSAEAIDCCAPGDPHSFPRESLRQVLQDAGSGSLSGCRAGFRCSWRLVAGIHGGDARRRTNARASNGGSHMAGAGTAGFDRYALLLRYSDGDCPVIFRNNRVKYVGFSRPRANEISLTGICVSPSILHALSIRICVR